MGSSILLPRIKDKKEQIPSLKKICSLLIVIPNEDYQQKNAVFAALFCFLVDELNEFDFRVITTASAELINFEVATVSGRVFRSDFIE